MNPWEIAFFGVVVIAIVWIWAYEQQYKCFIELAEISRKISDGNFDALAECARLLRRVSQLGHKRIGGSVLPS